MKILLADNKYRLLDYMGYNYLYDKKPIKAC
jgi:hypothetical protein